MSRAEASGRSTPDSITAVTHIHTEWSQDSVIGLDGLGSAMVEAGIDLAMVSDHDSFEGALAFAEHCESRGLPIVVPVSAEIRTDRGDILVVFEPGTEPPDVPDLLSWDRLVDVVRPAGGTIGLPHPLRAHTGVEELAAEADFIEVFNARTSDPSNLRAEELWEEYGGYRSYGVDAHLMREVATVIVEYPSQPTVRETILQHGLCDPPGHIPWSNKAAAEVMAAVRQRRPVLATYMAAKYVRHRTAEAVRRK